MGALVVDERATSRVSPLTRFNSKAMDLARICAQRQITQLVRRPVIWNAAIRPASRLMIANRGTILARHASYTPQWTADGVPPTAQFRSRSLPFNTVVMFVPEREAWIVERMGKFTRVLEPGLAFLIPLIDKVRYVQSLKEVAIAIPSQSAITADNVQISMDGVLYFRIVDPYRASYGVENAEYAVAQLAQTTMRAEIGQMTLDRTLAERAHLNANITDVINAAADDWGIKVLRYEIRDIHPPENVVASMHTLVAAERSKRAMTLESEGHRQAAINKASGESEAILLRAKATAQGIQNVAQAISSSQSAGQDAVALSVSTQYMDAFGKLAKEGNTVIVPASLNDPSALITQALSIYGNVSSQQVSKRGQRGAASAAAIASNAEIKDKKE